MNNLKIYLCIFFFGFVSKLYSYYQFSFEPIRRNSSKQKFSALSQKYYEAYEFRAYLPKIKYEYGNVSSINLGLSFIDYTGDDIVSIPLVYHGPFIETGYAFTKTNKMMCNKVGYEYFVFFGGRFNFIQYTDLKKASYFIRPEIGFSFCSLITATYGLNLKLGPNSFPLRNGGVFSINIAYFIDK